MSFQPLLSCTVIIWGVDVGVRSFHMAGLDERGGLQLYSQALATPKSVRDQDPTERWFELYSLAMGLLARLSVDDRLFIEEPPCAGSRNLRTYGRLSMTAGALMSASFVRAQLVPVDTWKKVVVGAGGASKERVSQVLAENYESYSRQCGGDQNRVDAVCIALYGRSQVGRAAPAGGLDHTHEKLAAC